MRVERLDESAWNHWSNDRGMGGRMGVEYASQSQRAFCAARA